MKEKRKSFYVEAAVNSATPMKRLNERFAQLTRPSDKAERLDAIADRILIANNWNELLKN